jgi:hypothetical protein
MNPKRKFTAMDLVPGRTYRVVVAFEDYDRQVHQVGESWRFLRKNFVPYDDGLTLFVEKAGSEISIRLQWRPETQGSIIDGFSDWAEES